MGCSTTVLSSRFTRGYEQSAAVHPVPCILMMVANCCVTVGMEGKKRIPLKKKINPEILHFS